MRCNRIIAILQELSWKCELHFAPGAPFPYFKGPKKSTNCNKSSIHLMLHLYIECSFMNRPLSMNAKARHCSACLFYWRRYSIPTRVLERNATIQISSCTNFEKFARDETKFLLAFPRLELTDKSNIHKCADKQLRIKQYFLDCMVMVKVQPL